MAAQREVAIQNDVLMDMFVTKSRIRQARFTLEFDRWERAGILQ